MKKVLNLIYSSKATVSLLLVLAISLAIATFIEDRYDTITAKHLVYNAKWFEFLLLLLVLNFIGNISRYKLLSRKKIAGFTFHVAFILMIIGAGITRYIGFDGYMHIREGESSNILYTSDSYLQVIVNDKNNSYSYAYPLNISDYLDNEFHFTIPIETKGEIEFTFQKYVKNSIEEITENVSDGVDIIELSYSSTKGLVNTYIKDGEIKKIGDISIAYNNDSDKNAINVTGNELLYIVSPGILITSAMDDEKTDTIAKDSVTLFKENNVYNASGTLFLVKKLYKKAKKEIVAGNANDKGVNLLIVDVTYNGKKQEVPVITAKTYGKNYMETDLGELSLKMAYASKEIILPFSLFLDDYILERYPGSTSPSSYKSEVTLIDSTNNLKEKHAIYMNNVLDYKGYRFFQSSYDSDERGTILSVNHDFWGTWVSYLGYLFMGLGFVLTLLNRNSRFYTLRQNIKKIRATRKAIYTILFLLFSGLIGSGYSQTSTQKPVSEDHANRFGHLIVQTFDGRFEPIHTLAFDVMHKISRKDKFEIDGKGKMDAMQVFIDMLIDSKFWKKQNIIYIREKSVRDVLGVTGKYASYSDFFDNKGTYKLANFSETAFRKNPSSQNAFDKEIIKLDERLNITMVMFEGGLLKIFPIENSNNNKWLSWDDELAGLPLIGKMKIINDDLQLEEISYTNILLLYFQEVIKATQSNDYSRSEKILDYIGVMQRESNVADIIPTNSKVDFEIFYNRAKIFESLRNIYGLLSLVLLVLAFAENLKQKKSKIISRILNVFIVLLGVAFIYHTYGMGLRWYLSGHAPWSNGYEALILVSWGGLLAGFCFLRYSRITLAATTVLAFIMLMTAGHSSYDPQLTNLQPVLKSYWLILHVATITISYGFLGLGFLLGLINICLYIFKTGKNAIRHDLLIKELTFINEMNLEIGIVLAAIGTFLGGIWANESWGRYWGWDAKETWALIIVIFYALVLHLRLVPKLKSEFIFNVSSIFAFSTVIMTFVGVNYYLSKGMHSYAADDTAVFPLWAWIMILSLILLIAIAAIKEELLKKT